MRNEVRVAHTEHLLKQHACIGRIDTATSQGFRDIQCEFFVRSIYAAARPQVGLLGLGELRQLLRLLFGRERLDDVV